MVEAINSIQAAYQLLLEEWQCSMSQHRGHLTANLVIWYNT